MKRWGVRLSLAAGTFYWLAWKAMTRFTGMKPCDIARKTAVASYWAAYHWARGDRVWVRLYIQQEDLSVRPDRCHV